MSGDPDEGRTFLPEAAFETRSEAEVNAETSVFARVGSIFISGCGLPISSCTNRGSSTMIKKGNLIACAAFVRIRIERSRFSVAKCQASIGDRLLFPAQRKQRLGFGGAEHSSGMAELLQRAKLLTSW
jgi:hypothetical protein